MYVVGVSPPIRAAASARPSPSRAYLQEDRGLDAIVLYVDGTNSAARGLYTSLGFTTAALDVQFAPSQL